MREYLKTLREQQNLTQMQTARKTGVSCTYYNYIEAGLRQKDMSYSMMEKLATALDVSVQTIINAEAEYIDKRNSA